MSSGKEILNIPLREQRSLTSRSSSPIASTRDRTQASENKRSPKQCKVVCTVQYSTTSRPFHKDLLITDQAQQSKRLNESADGHAQGAGAGLSLHGFSQPTSYLRASHEKRKRKKKTKKEKKKETAKTDVYPALLGYQKTSLERIRRTNEQFPFPRNGNQQAARAPKKLHSKRGLSTQ